MGISTGEAGLVCNSSPTLCSRSFNRRSKVPSLLVGLRVSVSSLSTPVPSKSAKVKDMVKFDDRWGVCGDDIPGLLPVVVLGGFVLGPVDVEGPLLPV